MDSSEPQEEPRELTPAHRSASVELWDAAGLTRPWNSAEVDFDRALDGKNSTVLGAFVDDRVIGTVMVGHDGHRGWVYYLAIESDRGGEGLGRALMGAAEAWLVERGVPKLNLMVRLENTEAVGFYEQLGYERSEVTVFGKFLSPG